METVGIRVLSWFPAGSPTYEPARPMVPGDASVIWPFRRWLKGDDHNAVALPLMLDHLGVDVAEWPWVRALLHYVCDQSDANSVVAQYDRGLDMLAGKLP